MEFSIGTAPKTVRVDSLSGGTVFRSQLGGFTWMVMSMQGQGRLSDLPEEHTGIISLTNGNIRNLANNSDVYVVQDVVLKGNI